MQDKVSPLQLAKSLDEYWSPRVISEVDNYFVKVAKVKGEFTWHSHDQEDELFMILAGSLTIEMEDKPIILKEGELYVVPKGKAHNPVAVDECLIMLFERKDTQHTGDVVHEKSRNLDDQLRPL